MKFPNVVYAISIQRQTHYEIAKVAGISEWRFSRLLNGRGEFTPRERERLAQALNFDESWLFQRVMPPTRSTHSENGRRSSNIVCSRDGMTMGKSADLVTDDRRHRPARTEDAAVLQAAKN